MENNNFPPEKLNDKTPYSPPKTVKIAQRPKKAQRAQDSIDMQIDKISKSCGENIIPLTKVAKKRENASINSYNHNVIKIMLASGMSRAEMRAVMKEANIFKKQY